MTERVQNEADAMASMSIGVDVHSSGRPMSRPGGRAARIQAAVLQAVQTLKATAPGDLTIPLIAAQAGVTPSTIYRRWGSLPQLLADVAVRELLPDTTPADTGNWRHDLAAWLEQFVDEMASDPGRALLHDALGGASPERAGQCADCILRALDLIVTRAQAQGEQAPAPNTILDQVVAPVIYRILFCVTAPDTIYAQGLLDRCLAQHDR